MGWGGAMTAGEYDAAQEAAWNEQRLACLTRWLLERTPKARADILEQWALQGREALVTEVGRRMAALRDLDEAGRAEPAWPDPDGLDEGWLPSPGG